MIERTVELDETQVAGLRRLAAPSGMSEGELIREAVDRYLAKEDRLTRLQRAFGAWADDDEAESFVADSRQPAVGRRATGAATAAVAWLGNLSPRQVQGMKGSWPRELALDFVRQAL